MLLHSYLAFEHPQVYQQPFFHSSSLITLFFFFLQCHLNLKRVPMGFVIYDHLFLSSHQQKTILMFHK